MSFSQDIKNGILASKIKNKCCSNSLRYGELSTESSKLDIPKQVMEAIKNNICCKKAFIKGVFLGSGCIVNPKNDYHFEISFNSKKLADISKAILKEFKLNSKTIKRGPSNYVIYIKDSEQISEILRILEANKCLLDYENIRIEKSIKNDINRSINCETANMSKTVNSAIFQIEAIDKLIENKIYDSLSVELQEMCMLRKRYINDSLADLAKKCKKPISRSGVNHRLKKIMKIASEL